MRLTIFTLFLLVNFAAFSQTVVAFREAPLQGTSSYFLNGTAFLEELDNGSFQFRLDNNYATPSGPDVQIHLTNDNNFGTPVSLNNTLLVEDLGTTNGISHFSGAITLPVSGLTSLTQFDHLVFVCVQFGQLHWGDGSFGAVIPVCTNTAANITEQICGPYTAPSGAIYTQSGMYSDTIPNGGGCDSIIAIALTVDTINTGISTSGQVLTANDGNASYQWIDCDNNNAAIPGETNQSYTATATGNYAVIVTNGTCSDTSACFSTTVTGIEADDFGSAFSLYPNPAQEQVILDLSSLTTTEPVQVIVTNLLGAEVSRQVTDGGSREVLDVTSMKNGLYFVRVQTHNQQKVLRLVKQ